MEDELDAAERQERAEQARVAARLRPAVDGFLRRMERHGNPGVEVLTTGVAEDDAGPHIVPLTRGWPVIAVLSNYPDFAPILYLTTAGEFVVRRAAGDDSESRDDEWESWDGRILEYDLDSVIGGLDSCLALHGADRD